MLDPSEHYTLWLGFVEPEIRAVPGTLANNVVHFALPAFMLATGKSALGEIDGDPR